VDVVTYALAKLGGLDQSIHLERIAVKAHELAPGAFRWDLDEYANAIDKDKVRVSLTDAEKGGNGARVEAVGVTKSGRSKRTDFWRLTSRGAAWILNEGEQIERFLGSGSPQLKKGKATGLRKRLVSSSLFAEFQASGQVGADAYAFTDLLECSPDASDGVVRRRFDELSGQVLLLDDPELKLFLDVCYQAHADLLGKG